MDLLFSIQAALASEFKELAVLTNGLDGDGRGILKIGFPDSIPVTATIIRSTLGELYHLHCGRFPRQLVHLGRDELEKEIRDLVKHQVTERPLVRMIQALSKRVDELEATLYAPGGPEYEKARANFESRQI